MFNLEDKKTYVALTFILCMMNFIFLYFILYIVRISLMNHKLRGQTVNWPMDKIEKKLKL